MESGDVYKEALRSAGAYLHIRTAGRLFQKIAGAYFFLAADSLQAASQANPKLPFRLHCLNCHVWLAGRIAAGLNDHDWLGPPSIRETDLDDSLPASAEDSAILARLWLPATVQTFVQYTNRNDL